VVLNLNVSYTDSGVAVSAQSTAGITPGVYFVCVCIMFNKYFSYLSNVVEANVF